MPSYEHEPQLAPTQQMLDTYKKHKGDWADYETSFLSLMEERRIHDVLDPASFVTPTALLCSEATAEHCHRRLVCEHLTRHWPAVTAVHL